MRKTVLLLFAMILAMSSFAQSAMTPKNTITPGAGEAWWGYFTDNDANAANFSAYGVNTLADYDAAIKIAKNDPVMGNATVKAMRLWLNSTTIPKITSLKIWVAKNLSATGVLYTQDIDLSTLTAGANDIALNTPFAINNAITYFGYSITLSSQDYAIMNGGEYEPNTFFFRATAQTTNWTPVTNHGKLALQLMGEGVNIPQNAAIFTNKNLGTHNYQVGDEAVVPVTIKNKGVNNITSVSYTITSNNDPSTATPEVTVPINNIVNGATATFDVSFDTSVPLRDTRTVTITKVNGQPNDAPAADCVASGQFTVVAFLFTRVPVIEEFTGTWCGWCPRGFVGMEMAHEKYGDQVVLIAAHNGDPMEISDYNPVMSTVSGFPDARVNRATDIDPNPDAIQSSIDQSMLEVPVGMVQVTAQWDDEQMKTIKMDATSKFAFAEENANYGIAFVLTEDGMKGTSSSWAQSNYYSGQSGYPSYMDWWCSQGSKVTGLEYNFVAVGAWQIASGFSGSVPTSFEAGEVMPFSYTADISAKTLIQDKSKLKVAALLIDRGANKIINAWQTTINPYGYNPVPSEFYMVGTFNEWNTTEAGGRLAFTATEDEGVYEATGTLEAGAEFKVITPNGDDWTWYGGVDENNVGFFMIYDNLLNTPLQMVDGSNFRIENGGEFTFRINANDMTLTVLPIGGPVVPGDVNGDGVITAADVTLLYNIMLNDDNTGVVNGDQNGDGVITSADITAVYNILLGTATPSQNVYVLGEVNGNTWGAATGVKMNTVDGKVFTAQITTTTYGDYTKSYFGLTKALASANDNWEEIEDKRFGPTTPDEFQNFVISDDVLGQVIPLVTTNWRAFEAPTGTVYNLTVDLEHMTIVITKVNP